MKSGFSDYIYALSGPRPLRPGWLESGKFSFRDGALLYDGIAMADVRELRLLFRRDASRARRNAATKPWLAAQLTLYGIDFAKSARIGVLWDKLAAAVLQRRCDRPSATVLARQEAMAKEWKAKQERYEQDERAWHEAVFARMTSVDEQAYWDVDMFLAKHFLDGNGAPAPRVKKEAVVVKTEAIDRPREGPPLSDRVAAVDGLAMRQSPYLTVIGWHDGFELALDDAFVRHDTTDNLWHVQTTEALFCPRRFADKYFMHAGRPAHSKTRDAVELHWAPGALDGIEREVATIRGLHIRQHAGMTLLSLDAAKIEARIREMDAEHAAKRAEKARQAREEEREREEADAAEREEWMEPHREYLFQRHRRGQPDDAAQATRRAPVRAADMVGSWIATCKKMEEYGEFTGGVDVAPHGVKLPFGTVASFDFGLFSGIMLLAESKGRLDELDAALVAGYRKEHDFYSSDGDSEGRDSESGGRGRSGPAKRKREPEDHGDWGARYGGGRTLGGGQTAAAASKPLGGGRPLGSSTSVAGSGGGRVLGNGPTPAAASKAPSGRLLLRWAGSERNGTAVEPDDRNFGHLDVDALAVSAKGTFRFWALFGDEDIEFEIFKVGDEPTGVQTEWGELVLRRSRY